MCADVKEVAFEMWLEDISCLRKPEAQAQPPGRRLFI